MIFKIWPIQLPTFKHCNVQPCNEEWGQTDQQAIINSEAPQQGDTGCNGSTEQERLSVWRRGRWKDQENEKFGRRSRMGSICQEAVGWVLSGRGNTLQVRGHGQSFSMVEPTVLIRAWQGMRQLSFSLCFWNLCLEACSRASLAFPTTLEQLKTFVFSPLFAVKTDRQNCSYEDKYPPHHHIQQQ